MSSAPYLGVLAGEKSGDILAGSVLRELKRRNETLRVTGIGGEATALHGLESLYDMDRLAVFGFTEPLKRLPELLSMRRGIRQHMLLERPDIFLGVDSPDFNLTLEQQLRAKGLKTAHLVSPSVWAWRPGRINKIKKAVDLMLCLLPFEKDFYAQHGVEAVCVGHPLIEEFSALPDQATAKHYLGLPQNAPVLACLPGSRSGEIEHIGPTFTQVVMRLLASDSEMRVILPASSEERMDQINRLMPIDDERFLVIEGQSRLAMTASDAVLCASGTTTLEAMLIGKPMTIAYKMSWFSWQILSRMVTSPFVGLPNVIAGRAVAPEFLQGNATVENLYQSVLESFSRQGDEQKTTFSELRQTIGDDYAVRSADALEALMAGEGFS
jgi:lipid-A-disaccharide synthase